ncbi:nuclear transport factor 2 family protein [bacterium BD-1]|nr:nuclear transport factor 2 family protein [Ottowia caeni]
MESDITLQDQWAATNLLVTFYRALDERNIDVLIQLLHPETVWWRQGKPCSSEAEIRESLGRRSSTSRIHHLLSNLMTRCIDTHIEITAYMLVVSHDDGIIHDGPVPLKGIKNIRTARAIARRWNDSWRLSLIKSDAVSFAA